MSADFPYHIRETDAVSVPHKPVACAGGGTPSCNVRLLRAFSVRETAAAPGAGALVGSDAGVGRVRDMRTVAGLGAGEAVTLAGDRADCSAASSARPALYARLGRRL